MTTKQHTPPTRIGDCEVYANGDPLTVNGEEWLTLCPEDGEDERLWEFSLTTGRIIQTAEG